ncbi:MAG: cytochrome c [Myxococcota bacterium]
MRRLPRRVPEGRGLIVLALASAFAGDAEHGARLAGLGACAACHTADGGEPYAGGHAVETPFGTFYGSNLTPDPEHGIGTWAYADFVSAMRRGKGPDGAYWPAFPYTSFNALTDADLEDLWAFLQTVAPVATPDREHDGPAGWKRWAWRRLAFRPHAFEPDPTATPEQQRGQYLVDVVGHCGECHSPRSRLGRVDRDAYLEGGTPPFNKAPPIDREALASWTHGDLESFFEMGMLPDGDFVGSGMYRVVEDGTAKLSPEDRAAIIAWLTR